MDKNAIKNYAVWARKKLIEDISQKAFEMGITENNITEAVKISDDIVQVNGRMLQSHEVKQRENLIIQIKQKGFKNVIEEAAYTWFNRVIAIRFMEANDYLPTGVRVLSSTEAGKAVPDIVTNVLHLNFGLDLERVYRYLDEHNDNELFRYLFTRQCNKLNEILPYLFCEIEDFTELLLPNNLLIEGSFIKRLISEIPEENFKEQVEIIGWLYQYYISDKKDEVIQAKQRYKKDEIPYATQLFTPDWIVRYIVQNSLGRYWVETHPEDIALVDNWEYYLQNNDKPEMQQSLQTRIDISLDIKQIKVFDPCMGSGHILVYAFDVLFDIYKNIGYSEREIPRLILQNNLYGLDIDDRAAQLAYFAVMMKARSKSRRIFSQNITINICSITESHGISKEIINFFINGMDSKSRDDVEYLINIFHDAKEYGSILEVKSINFEKIDNRFKELETINRGLFIDHYVKLLFERLQPLVKQAKIMCQKYNVICTNPPYMSSKYMTTKLIEYINNYYPKVKSDLFAVFIQYIFNKVINKGHIGLVTPFVWMFISTYEHLRKIIVNSKCISSLIQLEYNAFESACIPVCAFTLRNEFNNIPGEFIRLTDFKGIDQQSIKTLKAVKYRDCGYRYSTNIDKFQVIPGSPIAYWVSEKIIHCFSNGKSLGKIAEPRQGLATGDNNRFLRLWHEIDINKVGFGLKNADQCLNKQIKWVPCNKGGPVRKWYGNNWYLINWENNGCELKNFKGSVIRNERYYFKQGLTWSSLTSSSLSVRCSPCGFIFESKGPVLFPFDPNDLKYIFGFLNSKVVNRLIKFISPTIDYHEGPLGKLPIIFNKQTSIDRYVDQNVWIARSEWNSFEISWEFKKHPLLSSKGYYKTVQEAFNIWSDFTTNQFDQLKKNEEELNRIFIEVYGLQDELAPEVEDNDVTVRKADKIRDIKSFISYAVGCMFGRYSLSAEGLIYAGGEWSENWHNGKVHMFNKDEDGNVISDTWVDSTYLPDADNVMPILEDEYFEHDIVSRFVKFLKVTFDEEKLEENIDFIAETLGRKTSETSRQAIRQYFLKDFYKDHLQTYKKRPIYWLFESGKEDGFKALIYMHRYDEFTVAKVRTEYLHKLQKKYEAEVKRLDVLIDSNVSQREKTAARKKKEKLQKQMQECLAYDQVIAHVANQRVSLNLDDGIVVNYAKFQGIEIPQGDGRKPLMADLLAKI